MDSLFICGDMVRDDQKVAAVGSHDQLITAIRIGTISRRNTCVGFAHEGNVFERFWKRPVSCMVCVHPRGNCPQMAEESVSSRVIWFNRQHKPDTASNNKHEENEAPEATSEWGHTGFRFRDIHVNGAMAAAGPTEADKIGGPALAYARLSHPTRRQRKYPTAFWKTFSPSPMAAASPRVQRGCWVGSM